MRDVLVLFDGTDQQPDGRGGLTNVFRFGQSFKGIALYEPGVGTWEGWIHWPASVLGVGLYQRIDDALDRLELYRHDSRVSVVGGSRGAAQALTFCWRYEARFGVRVHFCGLYDVVRAYKSGALKRGLLPRSMWGGRRVHERPPARYVVHAMAGREPSRLFAHDVVKDVDYEWTFTGLKHGEVLRDSVPRRWLEGHAEAAGLVRDSG